jgi:hypothetical protein
MWDPSVAFVVVDPIADLAMEVELSKRRPRGTCVFRALLNGEAWATSPGISFVPLSILQDRTTTSFGKWPGLKPLSRSWPGLFQEDQFDIPTGHVLPIEAVVKSTVYVSYSGLG